MDLPAVRSAQLLDVLHHVLHAVQCGLLAEGHRRLGQRLHEMILLAGFGKSGRFSRATMMLIIISIGIMHSMLYMRSIGNRHHVAVFHVAVHFAPIERGSRNGFLCWFSKRCGQFFEGHHKSKAIYSVLLSNEKDRYNYAELRAKV